MSLLSKIFGSLSSPIGWFIKATLVKKIIVLLLIGGISWFVVSKINGGATQPQYQTAQVTTGGIISTISESGNVSADNQTNVSSQTDGIIQELYVKNGDQVTTGDKLFKVQSTATPQQQASAYASFLSAQNSLQAAQSKMNSLQSALFVANQKFMTDRGVPNPSDQQKADPVYIEENATWLQSEADYKNQASVIAQTQAAYNSASLAYQATQDSVVTAPADGTVVNLSATIGSAVSAGTTTTTTTTTSSTSQQSNATTILVIGNFSNLKINVQASEVDVPQIHAGQNATITLDAFPNQTFVGKVASVDSIGTTISGVVTYNVYITLVAPPTSIKPGMTASAIIQTARKDNVLTVPTTAIQTSNGQSFVRVIKNGQITQTPVTTGIASDTDTEITSGLSEGDTIITSTVLPTTTSGTGTTTSPFSGLGGNRGFGGGGAVIRGGGGRAGGG